MAEPTSINLRVRRERGLRARCSAESVQVSDEGTLNAAAEEEPLA
jgi:hypothetical protein